MHSQITVFEMFLGNTDKTDLTSEYILGLSNALNNI